MINKIKNNLTYLFCAGLGLFNFIFLAFPYVESFVDSRDYPAMNWSQGVSGYKVMQFFEMGFSGVMSAIFQIIILILGIAILGFGVLGLLKAFGIVSVLPDEIGKFKTEKIGDFALYALAGLNLLLFIFLIILCASNTESYGSTSSAGVRLSAGVFFVLIFVIGAVVALIILKKKFPATEGGESVSFVCSQCGKKAKAKDKFCNACGGAIEKKVERKEEYVCSKCGDKATAKDKFCNECGGAIVKVESNEEKPLEESNS